MYNIGFAVLGGSEFDCWWWFDVALVDFGLRMFCFGDVNIVWWYGVYCVDWWVLRFLVWV